MPILFVRALLLFNSLTFGWFYGQNVEKNSSDLHLSLIYGFLFLLALVTRTNIRQRAKSKPLKMAEWAMVHLGVVATLLTTALILGQSGNYYWGERVLCNAKRAFWCPNPEITIASAFPPTREYRRDAEDNLKAIYGTGSHEHRYFLKVMCRYGG